MRRLVLVLVALLGCSSRLVAMRSERLRGLRTSVLILHAVSIREGSFIRSLMATLFYSDYVTHCSRRQPTAGCDFATSTSGCADCSISRARPAAHDRTPRGPLRSDQR